MNLTARPPRSPIFLRGVMPSSGVAPSGAARSAGAYSLTASVVGPPFFPGSGFFSSGPNFVTTDGARMASLFNDAARQLGLNAVSAGNGTLTTTPVTLGNPVRTWSLPVTLNAMADDDLLLRALSRAIYWSSAWYVDSGNQRTPVDANSSDGGSGLANTLRTRFGGASFAVGPRVGNSASNMAPVGGGGVALGSVPGSTTPPPGPVGGDSIVPIGGPGQMSAADLLASFCNKRPKDSEGALTGRDRQEYQAALTRLGYSTQGIDGTIGPNTRAAVQSFQRAKGVTTQGQPGYGTIGPQTQAAIIRAVCQGASATQPTPSTPATPMPLPATPSTPASTPRPSSPSTPQTAQPLANTPPPTQAGMGAGPVLLLAAAGAVAVFLLTKKSGKGARS